MLKVFQFCLFVVGFLGISYWAALWYEGRTAQEEGAKELDTQIQETPAPPPSKKSRSSRKAPPEPLPMPAPVKGKAIARMEVPRLKLSAVVFEGTDDRTLNKGVGHLPGSALPGQTGNVVLAAHRDTYFRALENIRRNDHIKVITPQGPKTYLVESTAIVTPKTVEVTKATSTPTLTLITCYPFRYVGSAPYRFIVKGRELDAMQARAKPAKKTKSRTALVRSRTRGGRRI
ncbi:MAG TPA: class D sortase [Bryobacteraceae bacterium]|nr:class D sortase [Bryobacteraceae bacterium]